MSVNLNKRVSLVKRSIRPSDRRPGDLSVPAMAVKR